MCGRVLVQEAVLSDIATEYAKQWLCYLVAGRNRQRRRRRPSSADPLALVTVNATVRRVGLTKLYFSICYTVYDSKVLKFYDIHRCSCRNH
jgi:hypothetical protein